MRHDKNRALSVLGLYPRETVGEPRLAHGPAFDVSQMSARLHRVRAYLAGMPWRAEVLVPAAAFLAVITYFIWRSATVVVPEGDSALHLQVMQEVAAGHLPKVLPYFGAVVAEGGRIEAFFPYSYTPLYHLFGGAVVKIGGVDAALMIGPLFAGLMAAGIAVLLRRQPWPVIALAVVLIFGHWLTRPIMTWVFMEPMMLAFFIGGLCMYQRSWETRSVRDGALAGLFFGLAVASRQTALLYLVFVAVHGVIMLGVEVHRRGVDAEMLRTAGRYYGAMAGVSLAIAAPGLAYLVWVSGTIGYGEIALPGLKPALPIDPVANDYLNSISTPAGTPLDWLARFWEFTLFTSRWQFAVLTYLPVLLFGIGLLHLFRSGHAPSQFLATYVPVHLLGEMAQFMTIHGNWRYIVASRVFFYLVVAVGIWSVVRWMYTTGRAGDARHSLRAGLAAASLTVAAIVPGFVTPGLIQYLSDEGVARAEKGEAFRELGAFVQERVPEDALILSGRWYTSGYHLQREYTWVTYYGNAWVIDAISTPSSIATRDLLESYGVDYIVIQAPPPTYVDRMPNYGLRRIVLEDLDHFQLIFQNDRVRFYRFWPDGMS